jgi:hypothetical protein
LHSADRDLQLMPDYYFSIKPHDRMISIASRVSPPSQEPILVLTSEKPNHTQRLSHRDK